MPHSAGNQTYTPSAKYIQIEHTLRSRITKQKAKNDQTRKTIASLEAKSVYLRRLKGLEKEVAQLEKEGRELARREEEVKSLVERDSECMEGYVAVAVDGEEHSNEDRGWEAEMEGQGDAEKAIREDTCLAATLRDVGELAKKIEKEMREDMEARCREAERMLREGKSEQKANREHAERAWAIKREGPGVVQSGHEENREVKQEPQVAVKNEPIEEIELLSGAAAWTGV